MTTYENTAEFFDQTAGVYDDWFLKDRHYMELLASIVRRLRHYAPRRILELGCGTGNLTALMAKHLPDTAVTAVDISAELTGEAAVKCDGLPNVEVRIEDMVTAAAQLPSGASVVANYSVHHLVDDDKDRLCAELARSLTPGAAILIGDVFYPPPPPPPPPPGGGR
jgi:SAM-dependent methyltransferase